MIHKRKDARWLGGEPGDEQADYRDHITDPPVQAYAVNAIHYWPDESTVYLTRFGLTADLVLDYIPASLVREMLDVEPHGLRGGDLELAAEFWSRYVERFKPRDRLDARHWLSAVTRDRVRHWLPILLEHFAAEIRNGLPYTAFPKRLRRTLRLFDCLSHTDGGAP